MISLANAIIQEDVTAIKQLVHAGLDVNQLDEYGFRPIIEAAIIDNLSISKWLLHQGADPNQQDVVGGTALHWAADNNNVDLCQCLLQYKANPNAYNFAGQPVLVMPMLRRQKSLIKLLVNAGADQVFAQDYINTKMLGHIFELVGVTHIVDPRNHFVEIDFEGFFLEITLGLIANSLLQFQNHFAARQLRRYSALTQLIIQALQRASQLIKYQQYRVDIKKHQQAINDLLKEDLLVIPIGYEGHAIAFIRYHDIWVKCDRREDSRLYDNIMFYRMEYPDRLTHNFIKSLIYKKQTSQFINEELDRYLGLSPLTELKIEAQISGNCSWANIEATIPAIFFLILMQLNNRIDAHHKTLALNYFQRWRDWNKERALNFCIQSYERGDAIRKASHAEILAAILFQRCDKHHPQDQAVIESILTLLLNSPYQALLKNYLRVYYYESYTEQGKQFAELLKEHGYLK